MARLLLFVIQIFIPLTVIAGVSIFIDTRGYLSEKFSQNFAEALNSNHQSVYTKISERIIVKKRIELNNSKHFNKVVLGSSRLMNFGTLIDENVFNVSVPGADINDYEIIQELLELNLVTYDTIVFAGDPWLFNSRHGDNTQKLYSASFSSNSIRNILSWEYFVDNIKLKYNLPWDGNDIDFVFLKDGSVRYKKEFRNGVHRDLSLLFDNGRLYHMSNYKEIDRDLMNRFLKFFEKLKNAKHIEVVMVPYHNTVYSDLVHKLPLLIEIEEKYKILSSHNVKVIGSFDPTIHNLTEEDFYDAMHLKEEALKSLYNSGKNTPTKSK